MNQRCLSIVNRALSQVERRIWAICLFCLKTGDHIVLQSTDRQDVLRCKYCEKLFTIEHGKCFK
jgi:hypothetical protein